MVLHKRLWLGRSAMSEYNHINLGDESKGCNSQRKDGITLEVCIYN